MKSPKQLVIYRIKMFHENDITDLLFSDYQKVANKVLLEQIIQNRIIQNSYSIQ